MRSRCEVLNIDPMRVEQAIRPRTKAVFCVHYAGVACDMDAVTDLCHRHGIALVEDAAQGFGAAWKSRSMGGIGDLGTLSFYGTKNVSSGEVGVIVNRPDLVSPAQVAWEKGTDRLLFMEGKVALYQWNDLGSSFLPSDLTAALLHGEFMAEPRQTACRVAAWVWYQEALQSAHRWPATADHPHLCRP